MHARRHVRDERLRGRRSLREQVDLPRLERDAVQLRVPRRRLDAALVVVDGDDRAPPEPRRADREDARPAAEIGERPSRLEREEQLEAALRRRVQSAPERMAAVDDDALEPRVGRRRSRRRPDDEPAGDDRRLDELRDPLLGVVRELAFGDADRRFADGRDDRVPIGGIGDDELDERPECPVVDAAWSEWQQPVERGLRVVRAHAQHERVHVELGRRRAEQGLSGDQRRALRSACVQRGGEHLRRLILRGVHELERELDGRQLGRDRLRLSGAELDVDQADGAVAER